MLSVPSEVSWLNISAPFYRSSSLSLPFLLPLWFHTFQLIPLSLLIISSLRYPSLPSVGLWLSSFFLPRHHSSFSSLRCLSTSLSSHWHISPFSSTFITWRCFCRLLRSLKLYSPFSPFPSFPLARVEFQFSLCICKFSASVAVWKDSDFYVVLVSFCLLELNSESSKSIPTLSIYWCLRVDMEVQLSLERSAAMKSSLGAIIKI